MDFLIVLFSIFAIIGYPVLLIAGFVLSKKMNFKAGLYFFAIIFILHVCSYFSRFLWDVINDPPFDLTVGELSSLYQYGFTTIKAVAFLILILGLHRSWKESIPLKN